jgi:uncharacterized NAD-dependent epimerase/dehydratase family protein
MNQRSISTDTIAKPYLLFLGDVKDDLSAKTSRGIYEWRPEICVGQHRLPGCETALELPELSYREAAERGAKTVIVGVANAGGILSPNWISDLLEALEAGLDLASGLHMRLSDVPELRKRAQELGRKLHDIRHPPGELPVGTGRKRSGKRLLTVGTDCSIGKMYTSLALEKEMKERGMKVDFRATGQTGIFVAGSGICVDAVVADFIAGAAELLSPANDEDHWDIIEGQGSLMHPSFAGVSLGLLHGAQADALVMCHQPGRSEMRGLKGRPLPHLQDCIDANIRAGRLTNPEIRCIGISLNTKKMERQAALDEIRRVEDEFGLPCVDPAVTGVSSIVDRLASL